MKIKMILLFIISTLFVFIIYTCNYDKKYNITLINTDNNNINNYLSTYLDKLNIKYNLNVDYSNKTLEIENITTLFNNNEHNIKDTIYKSDLILLSFGNNDILNEDINTINKELSTLFSLIRKINNKLIIYIMPSNIYKTTLIKEICKKYKIIYINSNSFNNNYKLISKYIISYINTKNS